MRKLLVITSFVLFIMGIGQMVENNTVKGVFLSNVIQDDEIFLDIENEKVRELLGKLIILPEGEYDKSDARGMIKRISKIHPDILDGLIKNNVKIKLFTGKLTDEPAFSHLSGITPRGWENSGLTWDDVPGTGGTFLVAAKIGHSRYGSGHGSINLELHEVAHSVDRKVFGLIRHKVKYQKIWKNEAPILFPGKDYFLDYPEEYFAECFAMYYLNEKTRSELQKKAPKTFEYIKELEEKRTKITFNVTPLL